MPLYEYRCKHCHKRFSRLLPTYAAAAVFKPQCPFCGSQDIQRLISRVHNLRGATAESEDGLSDDLMADFNENDPRSLGKMMRRMSEESGEDLDPELKEVVQRLEKGQDPEQIEREMPDLADADADGADHLVPDES